MKLTYWTNEERKAILLGTKKATTEDVNEIIQRPILAHLDELMNMRVHAAVWGKGKFNKKAIKDENGTVIPSGTEVIPIKDRMGLAKELINLLLVAQKRIPPEDATETEQLQRDLGMPTV